MFQYARVTPDGRVDGIFSTAHEILPSAIRKHESGQLAIVRVVSDPAPTLRPGEKLVGPIEELESDVLRRTWRVEKLPADLVLQQKMKELTLSPLLHAVVSSLVDRVRALEGKPAMTPEQFNQWLLGIAQSLEREGK